MSQKGLLFCTTLLYSYRVIGELHFKSNKNWKIQRPIENMRVFGDLQY